MWGCQGNVTLGSGNVDPPGVRLTACRHECKGSQPEVDNRHCGRQLLSIWWNPGRAGLAPSAGSGGLCDGFNCTPLHGYASVHYIAPTRFGAGFTHYDVTLWVTAANMKGKNSAKTATQFPAILEISSTWQSDTTPGLSQVQTEQKGLNLLKDTSFLMYNRLTQALAKH